MTDPSGKSQKSIDSNHLVLDGRMSMSPMSLSSDNLADILGAHYYEGNYAQRCEDDTRDAHNAGKPFILGEFGAKVTAQPCIDVFQKGIEDLATTSIMRMVTGRPTIGPVSSREIITEKLR